MNKKMLWFVGGIAAFVIVVIVVVGVAFLVLYKPIPKEAEKAFAQYVENNSRLQVNEVGCEDQGILTGNLSYKIVATQKANKIPNGLQYFNTDEIWCVVTEPPAITRYIRAKDTLCSEKNIIQHYNISSFFLKREGLRWTVEQSSEYEFQSVGCNLTVLPPSIITVATPKRGY